MEGFSFVSGRWIPEVQQAAAEPNISKGDSDEDDDNSDDDENVNGDISEVKVVQMWLAKQNLVVFNDEEKNVRWNEHD